MNSPPSTLGQYQIIREIARSNDIVYEAYDPLMNRRVAIKELAMPQGASSQQQEERISRFKREAQAAGTLNHPNIMTVFSFAEDNGRTFMAMEYLDGCTLRSEIDTHGSLPLDRAVDIITQVLEGLSHAHSKGVIHRDIKPDNIQILSNGTVKITDFGIARLTFQPNLTMDGQVFGTPSYMSPEQVVGRDIDARSDLFSVGVVLYEMLAGQKPFGGDSVVTITYAIMNAEPPHPSQVSYSMWQILSRALEKSPQMRYASAEDMIKAIRDAVKSANSGVMDAAPPAAMGYGAAAYMAQGAVQPAPPPVYAYNPYQPQAYQPQAQQQQYLTTPYGVIPQQYQAGPSMPPPSAIPIYYPPPPRQPLLKPETVAFWKRVAMTFLIIGTLLVILIVCISQISRAITDDRSSGSDRAKSAEIANLPSNMPIGEKLQKYKEVLDKVTDVGTQADIRRQMASLYERQGKEALVRADIKTAEYAFSQGTDVDPRNPSLWSDRAMVLTQQVDAIQDAAYKEQLLAEAGGAWEQAARLEHDTEKSSKYGQEAARQYIQYAQNVFQQGDRSQFGDARSRLYNAKEIAGGDSELMGQITDMLQKLG